MCFVCISLVFDTHHRHSENQALRALRWGAWIAICTIVFAKACYLNPECRKRIHVPNVTKLLLKQEGIFRSSWRPRGARIRVFPGGPKRRSDRRDGSSWNKRGRGGSWWTDMGADEWAALYIHWSYGRDPSLRIFSTPRTVLKTDWLCIKFSLKIKSNLIRDVRRHWAWDLGLISRCIKTF